MKKSVFFIFSFLILLLGGITSCMKEKTDHPIANNDELASKKFINDVTWFMNAAKVARTHNNTKATSSEMVSLDSAIYYVDATLNFKYGFASEPYGKLHFDTVVVKLPLVADNKKVYLNDALSAYNSTIDKLRIKFTNLSGTKKNFMGCVVQNAGRTTGNDSIIVRVIGQFGINAYQPYNLNEDGFWWARNSFNCRQTEVGEGAPNVIDAALLFAYRTVPPPGYRYVYSNLKIEEDAFSDPKQFRTPNDVEDNSCDYKFYYASSAVGALTDEVKCIGIDQTQSEYELLFYIHRMGEVFNQWLYNNYQGSKAVFTVYTFSHEFVENDNLILMHNSRLTYGNRTLVDITQQLEIYPVSLSMD